MIVYYEGVGGKRMEIIERFLVWVCFMVINCGLGLESFKLELFVEFCF